MFKQVTIRVLQAPVYLYRVAVSPLIGPSCRFTPTCSAFALEAIATHGPLKGPWLALRRLSRCHPWSGCHGHDPVPAPPKTIGRDKTVRQNKQDKIISKGQPHHE